MKNSKVKRVVKMVQIRKEVATTATIQITIKRQLSLIHNGLIQYLFRSNILEILPAPKENLAALEKVIAMEILIASKD